MSLFYAEGYEVRQCCLKTVGQVNVEEILQCFVNQIAKLMDIFLGLFSLKTFIIKVHGKMLNAVDINNWSN